MEQYSPIDEIQRYCGASRQAEYRLSERIGSKSLIQSWRRRQSTPRLGNVKKLVAIMDKDQFFPDEASKERFINGLLRLESLRLQHPAPALASPTPALAAIRP